MAAPQDILDHAFTYRQSTNFNAKEKLETRPWWTSMKNHGFRKLSTVAGSEGGARPTLTQQLHGFSLTHAFQTKPCQRCSQLFCLVRWQGPSGILLPTPKPLFVR